MTGELTALSARAAVSALRAGEVAPAELIDAALRRMETWEPRLNALPTVCAERALARAPRADRATILSGLPVAIKDLTDVAGVRTTYGSPIHADHVPDRSDILVERLEQNGALVLAKSNTPEFGAGGNTFNEVFGETRNPWDTSRTAGGSSGGSAAALAAREVWLATGSDLGGSLRTPASVCSVVGLRPSPGRIARGPAELPFGTLSVEGPMARDVRDAALMLDAMAGPHPADPLALGLKPVAAEVRAVFRAAVERLADAGVEAVEASPDLADAPAAFQALWAADFAAELGVLYASDRDRLKPDIVWNVEEGLRQPAERLGWGRRARSRIIHDIRAFLGRHGLLLCPAACVAPFDAATRWAREVEGETFTNYVEWLRITSALTLTGCPVVALPCGFTQGGLPVGLQLVGPHRSEARLLSAAAAIEDVLGVAGRAPPG